MGAYENPQVAVIDYTQFSKNFMQSFAMWSQIWEQRRAANAKNKKKADEEETKRLQGTFVKPEKELGVMWTDRMTRIFREQVDQNVWANSSASERQAIIEKIQTESNGAKAIQQAINLDLTKIDWGTNPDLYGFLNAVRGVSSGNKNKLAMIGGRYNISADDPYNRSNDSNFTTTPGQIGLTYRYTTDDGRNVYYNADEIHDILVNLKDADQLYGISSEMELEYGTLAGVVNSAGKNFATKANSKRLDTTEARNKFLTPYIESGEATNEGWDYKANVSRAVDGWMNEAYPPTAGGDNNDNYDLAAGIFRNYIPGFEGHVYRPSSAQLEQMLEDQGRYIKNTQGDVGYGKWKGTLDEIYEDGKVTEEEKISLWKEQDKALKAYLEDKVWKTGEIERQFILPPDVDADGDDDGDDDDEFDGIVVNEMQIAKGTQEQLRASRSTFDRIQNIFDQESSRVANVANLSDEDEIIAEFKQTGSMEKIYKLSKKWSNKGAIEWLRGALGKEEKNRTANEKEAIELYKNDMATYDPNIEFFLNEAMQKTYRKAQVNPKDKILQLKPKGKDKDDVYIDLKDKEQVQDLYMQIINPTGQTAKDIYKSLFDAMYGKDYLK